MNLALDIDQHADQLLRAWPHYAFDAERPLNQIRFAAHLKSEGVAYSDALDILDLANRNNLLGAPALAPEEVHRHVGWAYGTTPVEQILAQLPKPEPQPEKIIYVVATDIALHEQAEAASLALESPATIEPAELLRTDYLVKGWLDRGTLAQVFGQWGSGKTFALLHMGVHIAAGAPWFGNRVRQGGVLYIGYEGARSMSKRVEALKRELPDLGWQSMPFRWVSFRWPLVRKGGVSGAPGRERLDHALAEFQAETGQLPALIIIDPLRDALGGSDSDVELTGPYVTLMRQICHTTGATVLTVHHPGHGDKARARGDSGIPGAMDTDIRISGENGRGEISATKQRDQLRGRMFYRLKVVELGQDSDGDTVSSCVIEQAKVPIECSLSPSQQRAWAAIVGDVPTGSLSEEEARKRCKDAGIPSNRVGRILGALATKKLITWDPQAATITINEIFSGESEE